MVISFGDNGLASYGKRMEIDLVDGEDDLTNGMCVNMYGLKGESTAHYESTALLARHPRLTTPAMNAINSLTDSLPNELSGNLGNICSLNTTMSRAAQPRIFFSFPRRGEVSRLPDPYQSLTERIFVSPLQQTARRF